MFRRYSASDGSCPSSEAGIVSLDKIFLAAACWDGDSFASSSGDWAELARRIETDEADSSR